MHMLKAMLVHHKYPMHPKDILSVYRYLFTAEYSWVERSTGWVQCRTKDHSTVTQAGLEPRLLNPEPSARTTKLPYQLSAPGFSQTRKKRKYIWIRTTVWRYFNLPFLSRIFPAPTGTSEENQTPCTGQVTLRYTPPLQQIVGCSWGRLKVPT